MVLTRPTIFAVVLMCAAGCQLAQWRVFQAKVPANVEKPAAQIEGEKRAARYIEVRSTAPVPDPVTAVADIHSVAVGLSASLGEPARPVTLEDKDAVILALRAGLKAKDAQLDQWKAFGRKYGGKPLEDTGINLAGPAGLLAFAGVIAACVFVPGFGYLLLRVLPLLWGALRQMAVGVEAFAKEVPDAAEKLKTQYLARKMDSGPKALISRVKKRIKPQELQTAAA